MTRTHDDPGDDGRILVAGIPRAACACIQSATVCPGDAPAPRNQARETPGVAPRATQTRAGRGVRMSRGVQ